MTPREILETALRDATGTRAYRHEGCVVLAEASLAALSAAGYEVLPTTLVDAGPLFDRLSDAHSSIEDEDLAALVLDAASFLRGLRHTPAEIKERTT